MAKVPPPGDMFDAIDKGSAARSTRQSTMPIGMTNEKLYEKFKEDLRGYVLKVLGIAIFLMLLYSVMPFTTDITDGGVFSRSGVHLRIDHGTGCHYLEGAGGGMIQRVDKEGNHICSGEPN